MRGRDVRPPAWLRRLLARGLPPEDRPFELEELDELYRERERRLGPRRARLWYAGEAARFALAMVVFRTGRWGMGARSGWGGGLGGDLKHALRALARSPTHVVVVALTLGLGIAANGTVYALANWVLLRPVPGVRDPDGLVVQRLEESGGFWNRIAHPDFEDLSATIPGLDGLAATSATDVHVASAGGAARVSAELVSAGYFEVLGVPLVGRGFLPEEGRAPGARTVVISEALAARLLGVPALGRTVQVNGRPYEVVGVAGDGFRGVDLPGASDAWFPAGSFVDVMSWLHPEALTNRGEVVWERMIGRRADAASDLLEIQAGANAALDPLRALSREGVALNAEKRLVAYEGVGLPHGLRQEVHRTLALMGVAALLLLLLAVANTANLALARAMARREQGVVRRALGASGWRLARAALVENGLLGLIAGGAAVGLTLGGLALFRQVQLSGGGVPLSGAGVDLRVTLFLAATAAGAGLLLGAVPAVFAARFAPTGTLASGTRATEMGRRARAALVVVQFTFSVTLLIGASQLARTIMNVQRIDLGLDAEGVVLASLEPGIQQYDADRAARLERSRDLVRELLPAVRALPGVESAALVSRRPFASSYYPARIPVPGDSTFVMGRTYRVSAGLLGTMRIPLIAGRDFTEPEANGAAAPIVILNDRFARRLFPNGDAVGRQVSLYGEPRTVIGVAADARLHAVLEPAAEYVFAPMIQPNVPDEVTLVVRARGPVDATAASLREVLARFDPDLPLYGMVPLEEEIASLTGDQRAAARLGVVAAALGALLAAIGLYGSLATALAERRRELAVRLTLGAAPADLSRSVLRSGLALGAVGSALGLGGGLLLGRAMRSLLWEVGPFDLLAGGVALTVASLLAGLGSFLPARRVMESDPLEALRT